MPKTLEEILGTRGIAIEKEDVGTGGSATVHRCRLKEGQKFGKPGTVAVKQYNREVLLKPNQIKRIRQESPITSAIQNNNLVRAFHLIEERDEDFLRVFLVLEWIEGKMLNEWCAGRQVAWKHARRTAQQVLNGLAALHSKSALHRDIKADVDAFTFKGAKKIIQDWELRKSIYCTCWDGDVVVSVNEVGDEIRLTTSP